MLLISTFRIIEKLKCSFNVMFLQAQIYSKICLKQPLKNRQNNGHNGKWELNEGQKYCME